MNDLASSNNEYFDVKEEDEEREEYFPAQSMFIENEWIRNSPGGAERSKKQQKQPPLLNLAADSMNDYYSVYAENIKDSPYFENARVNSENVRFISPIQSTKNPTESVSSSPKINGSILDELLPTQIQLNPANHMMTETMTEEEFEKRYLMNDRVYGQVFKGSLIAWALSSVFIIFGNAQKIPINGEIGGWFTCLLILGLGMTAVWARLLAERTEIVVYGLMLAVPAGFGLLGMFSFSHWFILTGLIFLAISVVSAAVVYFNKETLKTTVEIVHNAAIFIQATPKVYPLVLKIVAAYLLFLVIWLKAFMGLFNNPNWSLVFSTTMKVAFIIILLWTGAVLSTVQKFILSTWVRTWMNQTEDDYGSTEQQQEDEECKKVNEESFGSICLAAGLLTIGKVIRIATKSVHFTSQTLAKFIPCSGLISELLNWTFSLIFVAEKFMQRFTDFAVYNLAVSKDAAGFINSCKQLGRVLDGHVRLAITTDATAKLLLSFSTILISFSSTVLILSIAKNHVTWQSSLLIGLLAASVTDFVSNTYTAAIDSMFLCYVMDLRKPERAGKIDSKIHEAFSTKLSSV